LIQKKKRPYQASSKSLDSGLMEVKTTSGGRSYVVVTPKGTLKLREALDRNTLYMCDDVITYPSKLKD